MKKTMLIALVITAIAMSCEQPDDNTQKPATGNVKLTGEPKVGGTLTADLSEAIGSGTPTVTIGGVAGNEYRVEFKDAGQKITLVAVYSNGTLTYSTPDVPTPTLTVQLSPSDAVYVGDELRMTATTGNLAAGYTPGISYSWDADNNNKTDKLSVTASHLGQTITGTAQFTGTDIKDSKATPMIGERAVEHNPKAIEFGTNLSTTVTGPAMTDTQWNAVITNLTAALNAAATGELGDYCNTLFGIGLNIDLVTNPPENYQYYKLDLSEQKLLLNANYAIGATQADLTAKVAAAINAVDGSTPLQAKAPAHDNGWQRMTGHSVRMANAATQWALQHVRRA